MTSAKSCLLVLSILFCIAVTVKGQQNCSLSYLMDYNTPNGIFNEARCCHNGYVNWYQRHGTQQNFRSKASFEGSGMIDRNSLLFEDTSIWNEMCRRHNMAVSCAHIYIPDCERAVAEDIIRNFSISYNFFNDEELTYNIGGFYDRTCTGETVKASINNLLVASVNTTCLDDEERMEFQRCNGNIMREMSTSESGVAFNALRSYYERLTVDAYNCMRVVVERSTCPVSTKGVLMHIARLYLPARINITSLNLTDFSQTDVTSTFRCTVGVYGDPHLRLCWQPRLITCSAPGLQNYLNNRFFSILAVNELVGGNFNSRATTITKIVMMFRSHDGSQQIGQYIGENGNLPQSFTGTNDTELGQGLDRITIVENRPYRVVMVHQALGAVIMVRRWRTNYFFTVRMAENVFNQSAGLLASGCPESQVISIGRWVGDERPRKRSTDPVICREACSNATDLFRESCEFDCEITDDIGFVNMTMQAEEDIEEVVTQDVQLIKSAVNPPVIALPTDAPTTQGPNSASSAITTSSVVIVFMSLFLLH